MKPPSITANFAARQVLRFGALAPAPSEVAPHELAKVLREEAISEEHAIKIVDAWNRSGNEFWPKPADIIRLAKQVPLTKPKPDKSCPACFGTGWEHVWTLETHEQVGGNSFKRKEIIPNGEVAHELQRRVDGIKQHVYSNVRRCTECRYGHEVAQEESVRRSAAAKDDDDLPVVDPNRVLEFPEPSPAPPPAKAKGPLSWKPVADEKETAKLKERGPEWKPIESEEEFKKRLEDEKRKVRPGSDEYLQ